MGLRCYICHTVTVGLLCDFVTLLLWVSAVTPVTLSQWVSAVTLVTLSQWVSAITLVTLSQWVSAFTLVTVGLLRRPCILCLHWIGIAGTRIFTESLLLPSCGSQTVCVFYHTVR